MKLKYLLSLLGSTVALAISATDVPPGTSMPVTDRAMSVNETTHRLAWPLADRSGTSAHPATPFLDAGKASRVSPIGLNAPDGSEVLLGGFVFYSDFPTPEATGPAHLGMWHFNTNGDFIQSFTNNKLIGGYQNWSSLMLYDKFYLFDCLAIGSRPICTIYIYDAETFNKIGEVETEYDRVPTALVNDHGTLYACFVADVNQYNYGTIDPNTGEVNIIAPSARGWTSAAIDRDGNVYVIAKGDDDIEHLYSLDKATGKLTDIGSTGIKNKYRVSATIEPLSGRLYWNVVDADEKGYLYEVNLTTGAATLLVDFPYNDQITGMYVPFIPKDTAPSKPGDVNVSTMGGSLDAEVTFTMPSTLKNGDTPLDDNMAYTIMANDYVLTSGTATPGQKITTIVTLPRGGRNAVGVQASNAGGSSATAYCNIFAGNDAPVPPANVNVEYTDGAAIISWDAVTASANGGYLDPTGVTYTVKRGDDIVASNISATSCTEALEEPETIVEYTYEVTATYDGKSSAPTSAVLVLGALRPPFEDNLDVKADFTARYTIWNLDGSNAWMWSNKQARAPKTFSSAEHDGNDDWLIFPAFYFESGKAYRFGCYIELATRNVTESFEIKLGKAMTEAADFDITVMPNTEYVAEKNYEGHDVDAIITVPQSGVYYLAIHSTSPKGNGYVFFDNFTISAPMSPNIPQDITDLTVTPDENGAHLAKISFTIPSKNVDSDELKSIEKVEIKRDDVVIETLTGDNAKPGLKVETTDNVEACGSYVYSVSASTAEGSSQPTLKSVYIGADYAIPPATVNITETETYGKVKVSWSAVTEDVNGRPLSSSQLKYQVRRNATDYPLIAEVDGNTTELEYTAATGAQIFTQVVVFPVTERGVGNGRQSSMIATGSPYKLPYIENFADGTIDHPLATMGGGSWGLLQDDTDMKDCDHNNGYLAFRGNGPGDEGTMFTLRIDLAGTTIPVLSVYTYDTSSDISDPSHDNKNEVSLLVREKDSETWTVLRSGTIHDLVNNHNNWGRISADLSAYKDKVVQVAIRAKAVQYAYTFFDSWQITEAIDNDLSAASLTVTPSAMAGEKASVAVNVMNIGASAVDGMAYSVGIFKDGEATPTAIFEGTSLDVDASKVFNYQFDVTPFHQGLSTYHAEVMYDADLNKSNNVTTEGEMRVWIDTTLPVPANLTATVIEDHGKPELKWERPDFALIPQDTIETFERMTTFNHSARSDNGWTFFEKDGLPCMTFQRLFFPNISTNTATGFFALDVSNPYVAGGADYYGLRTHRGDVCMVALSVLPVGYKQSDDWMVSPRLSGKAQTVSFYARPGLSVYPETIEMLYSTGDDPTDASAFVSAKTVELNKGMWVEQQFDIPEGANYFAIRYISTANHFMVMIDDVTYEPFRETPVDVVGYNLYRDGKKINDGLLSPMQYVDIDAAKGEHVYNVTAHYSLGHESGFSDEARVEATNSVNLIAEDGAVVSIVDRNIVIDGATSMVTISAPTGACLMREKNAHISVPVAPGIYLVSIGQSTLKVYVK